MSKSLLTLLTVIALLGLSAQAYAQASDVDCVKCIDTRDIGFQAVTTGKIDQKAVTTGKIAKQAVTTSKIRNGAVTENKLSPDLLDALQGPSMVAVTDSVGTVVGQFLQSLTGNVLNQISNSA